jgi:YidC/Oxa1 family membrane protein insertase
MACCCPASIIYPLGFGILALMNWLYFFIPNYGVVIIILVLVVRLILHPLTRKSQVSMSKYSKFNALPEVAELRQKYAKEPMELHKQITALQKERGLSPFGMMTGMLPTMIQMPIWIALYGAIYASIDLRGAAFLPFWITNLSAPDALISFRALNIPLFGIIDSFNLLPILMGVAFYLQQKLTPTQTAASTDPQVAQQQKIMMFMMPILFPLMLYNSPSGLNLYIMASVFGGVLEQYYIKKHIQEKEQAEEEGLVAVTSKTGGKLKKKKPKPFFKI